MTMHFCFLKIKTRGLLWCWNHTVLYSSFRRINQLISVADINFFPDSIFKKFRIRILTLMNS
jgi:hypothetical protein